MFIIIIITLSYAFLPPKFNHVPHATELYNLKKIKISKNDHESNKSKQPGPKTRFYKLISPLLSHFSVRLFVTPRTLAYQAPLSMELSRQEYWSGLPCPPPGIPPDAGIEPVYPASQAD